MTDNVCNHLSNTEFLLCLQLCMKTARGGKESLAGLHAARNVEEVDEVKRVSAELADVSTLDSKCVN